MNSMKPEAKPQKKLTLNRATVKRMSVGDAGVQPPAPGTGNSPQCPPNN